MSLQRRNSKPYLRPVSSLLKGLRQLAIVFEIDVVDIIEVYLDDMVGRNFVYSGDDEDCCHDNSDFLSFVLVVGILLVFKVLHHECNPGFVSMSRTKLKVMNR